ncbi:chromosomal replication initiator protein DnaA [Streptomyces silvensis]|uniref:Chromosomal replication initiator protein DnaA n=1 Tax=Streptomyces silvensis TaxID=1765722 RepID=A0A0W7WWW6_9ACTN|nr:chromosomal replication initiator protein DnaA [Streptomyces silvensis]KUF15083.1 hypothetical protein AT728_26835 [Streptomyces silvensis]
MGSLVPLGGDLPDESRALAEALRGLFDGLGLSVRRYAARRSWDAGSISRFLNGTRVPTWDFVTTLIGDVAEQHRPLTPEATELLRRLHREALARSGSSTHRVQVLEDELAEADRQSTRSAALVRALEGALVDAQHRVSDLEVQIGQLHAHHDRERADTDKALRLYEDQMSGLRRERLSLIEQVEALGEELRDAHARRMEAERRCEELERELIAVEEQQGREDVDPDQAGEGYVDSLGEDGDSVGDHGDDPLNEFLVPGRQTGRQTGPQTGRQTGRPPRPAGVGHSSTQTRASPPKDPHAAPKDLHPAHIFDTLIVGESNRFAHAAAEAVAESPGKTYNPLFLYGASGIGKTHLLHAIGHHARRLHPNIRVRYVRSEDFRRAILDVDILLVDDVQFLRDDRAALDELLRTFNILQEAGRQIVLSSDRPPKQLPYLGDRLRSRFEWGVVTHIQPPELATRFALLSRRVREKQLTVDPEALEFIAAHTSRNIRELEGALNRVTAYARLNRAPVDLELAATVLKDLVPDRGPSRGERVGELIATATADHFGMELGELRSRNRSRALVTARQIAMYLCCELTDLSRPKIGELFHREDPAVVDHAEHKIRALMAERRSIYNQITELTVRVKDAVDALAD